MTSKGICSVRVVYSANPSGDVDQSVIRTRLCVFLSYDMSCVFSWFSNFSLCPRVHVVVDTLLHTAQETTDISEAISNSHTIQNCN